MNKINFSVIWKISILTNATNKFWSLVMNGLADVDGCKICIQMCVWLRFPPLTPRKERNFIIAIIRIELCLVLLTELVAEGVHLCEDDFVSKKIFLLYSSFSWEFGSQEDTNLRLFSSRMNWSTTFREQAHWDVYVLFWYEYSMYRITWLVHSAWRNKAVLVIVLLSVLDVNRKSFLQLTVVQLGYNVLFSESKAA